MYWIKKIIDVGDWSLINDSLLAVQNNQINSFDLNGNYAHIVYELSDYWGVNYYKKFIHIFTMYSGNTIIDFNGKILFEKNDFSFYHFYNTDKFIGFDRKIKKVVNSDGEILFDKKISKSFFFDKKMIFTLKYDKEIVLIGTEHPAQPLWQFDFTQLGTFQNYDDETTAVIVSQILGVYNNIVWFYTNSEWFIGLDIDTGEQKHLLKNVPANNLDGNIHNYLEETEGFRFLETKYTLDKEKGIIHGLIHDKYYQIDLTKTDPIASIYGLHEEFKNKEIRPGNIKRHSVLVGNEFYFIMDEQAKFGIIDIETKKVKYVSPTITTKARLNQIQVSENKVYVLAFDATLYIYEKE